MSENLIKPYEISVWEDVLTQDGFQEKKIAVIGSNTMTGLNKVYDPVFNKKSNGEKTLTFSLKYKYFDPYIGNEDIINPFAALLVNERKVKLHYDNQWYEFIVKDHTESSDEYTWTYTCTDAFVLELSKQGYNITFDSELNNNQGTARELAEKTIKNTNWKIGGTDNFRQLIAEPIYKATLESISGIEIINTDTNEAASFEVPQDIYVFYSYVKNKSGQFVQFITKRNSSDYVIDSNNVITDTNYRIIDLLTYDSDAAAFKLNDTVVIQLSVINDVLQVDKDYQANRLAYNQLTTYDSIMERTVDVYKVEGDDRKIYKYTDYVYTTSDVIMNYITNGDDFNVLDDGSLQGWNPYTQPPSGLLINKLNLVTRPELGTGKNLADIATLSQIEGFLEVRFNGRETETTTEIYNTVYNSGIENNASFIGSISKGQQFVFRWRAGKPKSNDVYNINQLESFDKLGLIVAYYTQDEPTQGYYYKHIKPSDIILKAEINNPNTLNNKITGGTLESVTESGVTHYNYVIDGVIQAPSTKYVYINSTDDNGYVWDVSSNNFVLLEEELNYLPYYYIVATAQQSVSNAKLTDPTTNIGIFIYSTESSTYRLTRDQVVVSGKNYYNSNYQFISQPAANPQAAGYYEITPIYIQDIEFTRFIANGENSNEPIIIGNVPTALSSSTDYYYFEPLTNAKAQSIKTYADLNALKQSEGIGNDKQIVPVYNENSEKILSITASQSNCFNILQTIAETFECWIDLVVNHDDQGYITYSDGELNKYIYLREYAGKDNWAGFKYGINLQSIERTVNSDEIVTKLIVDMSQSDLVDEGYISIGNAPSNQSGESYILNFDYYYNQGLLDREVVETDRINFSATVADLNSQIREKEKVRRDLENSLTSITANRDVYTELVDSAKDMQTESLENFKELTGMTYEVYKAQHNSGSIPEEKQLTEEETIYELLGRLYVSAATINNYSGLLTNVNQEYEAVKNQLYGTQNYSVKIWVGTDDNQQKHLFIELNDYLVGFTWELRYFGYVLSQDTTVDTSKTYYEYDNISDIYIPIDDPMGNPSTSNYYEYDLIQEPIDSDTSTVSKKYFDTPLVDNISYVLSFIPPQSYTIESSTYEVDDRVTQVFTITSSDTIVGIIEQIQQIQNQKDEITNAFNNQYHYFIQEGTWNSTDYIDSELYYLDAVQVSNTSSQPQVSYTINVTEISEIEGFSEYLFDAGDKTYVEDTEFFGWSSINGILTPAREEVIVSEVEWHLDSPDQNVITVQNYKTQFEDLFQRINATVQTVQYNEATYAKMSSILDANGTINQDVLLESLNRLSGQQYNLTSNGSVMIDDDRILIQNLNNPANRVIINSEGIRVSSDGGQTWATAIDGQGINIGTVYTGSLNTNNVIIGSDDNPSFRWDRSGISAYRLDNESGIYDLQTYVRYDQYGLYGVKEGGSFKAQNLQDVLDKAHFAVTWDGFFIKNSYTDGRVEITSDNDFQVIQTINNEDHSRIKIGALEFDANGNPTKYGININQTIYNETTGQYEDIPAFTTGTDGNVTITGTINATGGNFSGNVKVGDGNPYIAIDGTKSEIRSSNYSEGAGGGWLINKDGDAYFNNITARGAIKTAVFEYAEIQAVGGIFIFRPSSTIRSAAIVENTNNLILRLEKPYLFKVGSWCKISNYTSTGEASDPDETNILENNGLTYVYRISSVPVIDGVTYVVLADAKTMLTDLSIQPEALIGGALVDMGNMEEDPITHKIGTNNYGIGINSSDNTVNLPARSISLFETLVNPLEEPKVNYDYKAVLGTLPQLSYEGGTAKVNKLYDDYLKGTQGLFTDNIYLGDANQYLTFYTDKEDDNKKKLVIQAEQILYKTNTGRYKNVSDPADYIWFDNAGAHVASGVINPSTGKLIDFDPDNSETFGYNALMATNKLALRYQDKDKVYIDENGLNILDNDELVASYGAITVLGKQTNPVHIEIDDISLGFYRPYSFSVEDDEAAKEKKRREARISYIESNKLYIPYSVILNEMVVGTRDKKNIYVLTYDNYVVAGKDYYEKVGDEYRKIANPEGSPFSHGWYELDTSDLWAWKVTTDEHLRLVWKGGVIN